MNHNQNQVSQAFSRFVFFSSSFFVDMDRRYRSEYAFIQTL